MKIFLLTFLSVGFLQAQKFSDEGSSSSQSSAPKPKASETSFRKNSKKKPPPKTKFQGADPMVPPDPNGNLQPTNGTRN